MDILEAQDAPIVLKIGTRTYTFPVWTTRELLPVLARLRAERLAVLKKYLASQQVSKLEAAYTLAKEETTSLDPLDAHIHFQTANGVDECLVFALVKSGEGKESAEAIIDKLRYEEKKRLAIKVANIFDEAPVAAPTKKKDLTGMGFGDELPPVDQPQTLGDPLPANPPVPAAGV